jgi:hypothetical protein
MNPKPMAATILVLSLAFAPMRLEAEAQSIVGQAEVQQALADRLQADDAARAQVRNLLQREDVRAMAKGMGLDVRGAEGAVATLEGDDLQTAAQSAAAADQALSGGATTVTISLVALLLIIIIVILVAS